MTLSTAASRLLRHGKFACRKGWEAQTYIGHDEDGLFYRVGDTRYVSVDYSPDLEDLIADDWQEYIPSEASDERQSASDRASGGCG